MLDGASTLGEVLAAVRSQEGAGEVEVLVADSGSSDGSRAIARDHGATIVDVPPGAFSHGGTRNLIAERAAGEYVAFLTQDAVPASPGWLAGLLEGFALAPDVALVAGPYLPRPGARAAVARELSELFAAFCPDGCPRVDRLAPGEEPPGHFGPLTFFSDVNGCVARAAWEQVPFREVPYAEDQLLARDMLAAGRAKAFHPGATVVHSHEYGALGWFRRFFDEWRGLREVHGHVEPLGLRATPGRVLREVAADRRFLLRRGARGQELARETLRSLEYHALRAAGATAGSRAGRLPPRVRAWCSLEGRGTFEPSADARAPVTLA